MAEGLANKQIARRLGITERTVKAHLTRLPAARRHRPHAGRALGQGARRPGVVTRRCPDRWGGPGTDCRSGLRGEETCGGLSRRCRRGRSRRCRPAHGSSNPCRCCRRRRRDHPSCRIRPAVVVHRGRRGRIDPVVVTGVMADAVVAVVVHRGRRGRIDAVVVTGVMTGAVLAVVVHRGRRGRVDPVVVGGGRRVAAARVRRRHGSDDHLRRGRVAHRVGGGIGGATEDGDGECADRDRCNSRFFMGGS